VAEDPELFVLGSLNDQLEQPGSQRETKHARANCHAKSVQLQDREIRDSALQRVRLQLVQASQVRLQTQSMRSIQQSASPSIKLHIDFASRGIARGVVADQTSHGDSMNLRASIDDATAFALRRIQDDKPRSKPATGHHRSRVERPNDKGRQPKRTAIER